ncbi:MAG: ATP-dependent sacrificial sulfur transferase LarE [Desulfatitalea sp.]|nr:ATP-dependent sacrificial sulfur transferase LarE [Desulfatitalea sp.]NNK01694.1 ATP-dependent sacrificial sulfur transferase LarE [Desulfatitalea sp.]
MMRSDDPNLAAKEQALFEVIGGYASLGVAFSGGVDSTVLLAAAKKVIGSHVVALTGCSAIHPAGEKQMAVQMADNLGVRHVLFPSDELTDEKFVTNPPNRCYLCKQRLFRAMGKEADRLGISVLAHGVNLDDLSDYRPGNVAADELGIVAPLVAAGLTKADIRSLAADWGLENWNRPAMACLASRIPYDTPISAKTLSCIDQAETYLRRIGVRQCRVRHHDDLARIETDDDGIAKLAGAQVRAEVVRAFQQIGYRLVCIDLEGYQSGKMNRWLNKGR